MSKFAWVTLATNDSYSLGALVVAHSLKRVHTAHQLAVLITPGVSEAMKTKLRSVFNIVQEVNLLDSKDAANLALLKRPELGITFTKLHCWRLTQFEKCVFLDADTLVLQNCDELFEREELSAAPDVGWPDCFNSGVFVFRPNLETYASLVQFAVDKGSFDGGDQGLLNLYFSDWAHKDIAKHLPFVYNTSSVASYSYLPAFKQFGQNTKILHFIGTAKPWLQNFDSETRQVHVPGGYQHLASFLQYWWDIFADDVHGRLSTEMQHMFSHWIKPSNKVSGGYGGYRSTGTLYLNSGSGFSDGGGGGDGNNNYNYSHGKDQHQHQHQQSVRNEFIPSYDAPVEYVDPWEEYLRKQAEEQEQRAREQRKCEEERLYFEYLDNKRNHERWLREQEQQHSHHAHVHHSHHESSEHSGHHQDANVFQRTDQWVEHAQRHDQAGHWQPDDQHFSSNYSGDGGGGGGGGYDSTHFDHSQQHQQESHQHHHHHHQQQQHEQQQQHYHEETQQQQQQHQHHHQDDAHRSVDTSDHHHHEQEAHQQQQQSHGDGSGLAGALAQLHLGEPKSEEQAAYEEHMRRQCWESGNIDYMGRDSFENIWRRITQTLSGSPTGGEEQQPAPPPAGPAPMRPISPGPGRLRKSRSRSTTPKRDGRDRSPTPTPEVAVAAAAEKKEGAAQRRPAAIAETTTPVVVETIHSIRQSRLGDTSTLVDVVDAPTKRSDTQSTSDSVAAVKSPRTEEPSNVSSSSLSASSVPSKQPQRHSPPHEPRQQPQQQVVPESMAGKEPSTGVEPVKSVRRKRLASPQDAPAVTSTITTTTTTATKTSATQTPSRTSKSSAKTVASKTATAASKSSTSPSSNTAVNKAASSNSSTVVKNTTPPPALPPKTTVSNNSSNTNNNKLSQSESHRRSSPKKAQSKQVSSSAPPSSANSNLTTSDQPDSNGNASQPSQEQQVPAPPVPPPRRRESKRSRIARFFRTFCTIL